jgi:hypothetical protein
LSIWTTVLFLKVAGGTPAPWKKGSVMNTGITKPMFHAGFSV